MLSDRPFHLSTVLDEHVRCAASLLGADTAIERAREAVDGLVEVDQAAVERLIDARPELTRCDDGDLSLHALTREVVADDVLTRATPEELAAIEAVVSEAWEEARDAVWSYAVRAAALRHADRTADAFEIEQTNENYVDSLRTCRDRGAPPST